MSGIKPAGQTFAAIALAVGGLIATTAAGARASDTTLCDYQVAPVSGGLHTVQNDEWNSAAAECVTTDEGADFTVASSEIANSTGGPPGGYPSIFMGCHYGDCTTGGLGASPLPLSQMARYRRFSPRAAWSPPASGSAPTSTTSGARRRAARRRSSPIR